MQLLLEARRPRRTKHRVKYSNRQAGNKRGGSEMREVRNVDVDSEKNDHVYGAAPLLGVTGAKDGVGESRR